MAIEIVDFPINSMVIFHSYVSHYQRVHAAPCCTSATLWDVHDVTPSQYQARLSRSWSAVPQWSKESPLLPVKWSPLRLDVSCRNPQTTNTKKCDPMQRYVSCQISGAICQANQEKYNLTWRMGLGTSSKSASLMAIPVPISPCGRFCLWEHRRNPKAKTPNSPKRFRRHIQYHLIPKFAVFNIPGNVCLPTLFLLFCFHFRIPFFPFFSIIPKDMDIGTGSHLHLPCVSRAGGVPVGTPLG